MSFYIKERGAPIVNSGDIVAQHDNCLAFEFDLTSKNCEADIYSDSDGSPGVSITATDGSLNLDESVDKFKMTLIVFPGHKDWEIFAVNSARYSVRVALVKRSD